MDTKTYNNKYNEIIKTIKKINNIKPQNTYTIYNNLCYDKKNRQLIGNTTLQQVPFSVLDLKNKPIINFDTILLFQNRWDDNFYHFMIETFHLLSFLFNDKFVQKYNKNNFKILINKNYCRHSYEILEVLGFLKYVHFMEKDNIYKSKNLIWSRKLISYKDSRYIKLVETLIIKSKQKSSIKCYDKIYLSREHIDIFTESHTPKRWITNQKEVVKIIQDNNYKKVRVDNMHIRDQITLINYAKKVITFIGAGGNNIEFANKDCVFSIIYAPNQLGWLNCIICNNPCNGIECLNRDNNINISHNHGFGKDDQHNGPYKANLNILKKQIN